MTTLTCTSDRYDNNPGNRYDSVEDFQRMCVECFDFRPTLVTLDHGETYCDNDGEVVLRRVTWEGVEIDPDDDCGVDGAVTVTVRSPELGVELDALMVFDPGNGQWSAYGDCPSMWLGGLASNYGPDTLRDVRDAAICHPGLRADGTVSA